ncbi:extracellular solute-binding protein [Brucellaceae bacterium C25G]
MKKSLLAGLALAVAMTTAAFADTVTIYSGRGEALIGPLLKQFEAETGIKTEVRFGATAELASLLMEEGKNTPADVFWAQNSDALGALLPYFAELPASVNETVLDVYRNPANKWVATSGRTRVLVYPTNRDVTADLPAKITDLTNEKYRGRVAWAPASGGMQAFVTAFRVAHGDDAAREWLKGMIANDTKVLGNTAAIEAVANGDIDFALVNNYYLGRYTARDPKFPAAYHAFEAGDIGNLMMVAGTGIVETSDNKENAQKFIDFLLSPAAQQYITLQGNEYPVRAGIIPHATLQSLENVSKLSPDVNINELEDLKTTLDMLREVGLL